MEKQILFSGILSNKPDENPGTYTYKYIISTLILYNSHSWVLKSNVVSHDFLSTLVNREYTPTCLSWFFFFF